MANLTLSLDDDVLRRARIRALESNTSVNAVVRDFLGNYAGTDPELQAMRELDDLAERTDAGSGSGRTWTREGLYLEHRDHSE